MGHSMKILFILVGAYLSTGLLVALALYLTRPRLSEDMQCLEEALEFSTFYLPEGKQSSFSRTSAIAVGYLLAGLIAIGAWPAAFYQRWQFIRSERKNARRRRERFSTRKEFQVQPVNLIARMTIGEIEVHETVQDPLNAVPNLPFGHLNAAWEELKSCIRPGDEIWTFSAQWQIPMRKPQIREGYAVVRAREVKGFLVATVMC
jgi:hypothetical protein